MDRAGADNVSSILLEVSQPLLSSFVAQVPVKFAVTKSLVYIVFQDQWQMPGISSFVSLII